MRIGVVCVIKESWGGSEELWAAMAHEAIAEGHEVIVSAYNCGEVHPKMQALISKGLKLVYRRGYVKPGLPTWKRILTKGVNILVNRISNPFSDFLGSKPDCILYNGTSYTCLEDKPIFETLISERQKYIYLSHIAADYYRPVGLADIPFISRAFNHSAKNLFVAKRTIKITERQIASKIPNSIVVRNPVNLHNLSIVPFPSLNGTINFATVGLLVAAHKGQDMLFEVLSSEKWQNRNWHLNIYGSGVDEEYLKKLTKLYAIENKVTFWGKVNNIRSVWQLNHILLMPSLMEGMPLAIVEAMLCGRPCLATDVGDHSEWIENEKEGFISEAPSPFSINIALEKAWDNIGHWPKMGLDAHAKAVKLYDPLPGRKLLSLIKETNN